VGVSVTVMMPMTVVVVVPVGMTVPTSEPTLAAVVVVVGMVVVVVVGMVVVVVVGMVVVVVVGMIVVFRWLSVFAHQHSDLFSGRLLINIPICSLGDGPTAGHWNRPQVQLFEALNATYPVTATRDCIPMV